MEEVALYSYFSEYFYHERLLNFVACFFCINCDDCVYFSLPSINVVKYIDCFSYAGTSLYSWDKSHLGMGCNPLNMLLDLVC